MQATAPHVVPVEIAVHSSQYPEHRETGLRRCHCGSGTLTSHARAIKHRVVNFIPNRVVIFRNACATPAHTLQEQYYSNTSICLDEGLFSQCTNIIPLDLSKM